MTLGHAIWLSEGDLDKLASTGTSVCHNCSSNFRLRSGVLPAQPYRGAWDQHRDWHDDMGINEDQDMLQEMRMVLCTHREPGMDDRVPTMAQVFRMATSGGARTTPYGETIGSLEVGKAADMVLIDWKQISEPYLDPETPTLAAIIHRAKNRGVRTVMVGGEIVYQDGKFTRVDRDNALREFSDLLKRPLTDDEIERKRLSKAVLPHVTSFYDGYSILGARAVLPAELENLGVARAAGGKRHGADISSGQGGNLCRLRSFAASMSSHGRSIAIAGSRSTTARCCSATGSLPRSARLRS